MPPAKVDKKNEIARVNGYDGWDSWVDEVAQDMGRPVCGALCRPDEEGNEHSRRPCRARQRENGRCHMHGGRSLRGVEHPNWQGRGWSKDLPTRLLDRFRVAMEDEDLTTLVHEIRLMDVRIGELLSRLGEGEGMWSQVKTITESLKRELDFEPDMDNIEDQVEKLENVIREARLEQGVWEDIEDAVEQRRKLAEAETRREEKLETHMTIRQANTVFSAIQMAIVQECDDETRRRILGRIREILQGPKEWPPYSTRRDFDDDEIVQDGNVIEG